MHLEQEERQRKDQTEERERNLSLVSSIHFHQAPDLLNDQFEVNDCLLSLILIWKKNVSLSNDN